MFARFMVALVWISPLLAHAELRSPFGPPGYELPDRVTYDNLLELSERLRQSGCKTRSCETMAIAIGEIVTNGNQRKYSHLVWGPRPPDIAYSAIKYREIERDFRHDRELWPDICRAVVEIGARDTFETYPEPYSGIAAAALDVSRHLHRPGLDCFAQTLAAMPQSKRLQSALKTVWYYCLNERRGAARCERYKPTDPQFLPLKCWPCARLRARAVHRKFSNPAIAVDSRRKRPGFGGAGVRPSPGLPKNG